MNKSIDARGLQCPYPVIETKKALKEISEGIIEVYVDNAIAVQNIVKMANNEKLKSKSEKIDDSNYIVRITVSKESEKGLTAKTDNEPDNSEQAEEESCYPDKREEHTIVVLSSEYMGEGDEQLGKTLMKGFIFALTKIEQLPKKIILYNGGARLSAEGSDSLEDLKFLESQGVEILTCGTCLSYYNIAEKLCVGSVTNMYTIAEIMFAATKIIKP
jgi:selenium metabolism protein YedF